jgi:hypothetical protein
MWPIRPEDLQRDLGPVLKEFGTTVYSCQHFENNLCHLLALLEEQVSGGDGIALGSQVDFHSTKTLGALTKALSKVTKLPKDFEDELEACRTLGNKVIHGYLVGNNNKRLLSSAGRKAAVEELKGIRGQLGTASHKLGVLIDHLYRQFGFDVDSLMQDAEGMWRRHNPGHE